MLSAVSKTSRRVVATGGPDGELSVELLRCMEAHAVSVGRVCASGILRSVTVSTGEAARTISGPMVLIGATGFATRSGDQVRSSLTGTLSRQGELGVEIFGGLIESAVFDRLELTIDAMDDIEARWVDQGLEFVSEAEDDAPTAPANGDASAVTWDEVARHSAEQEVAETADEPAEAPPIQPGDILDHPRFRRCTVYKIEGDREFLHIGLKNGRIVRLAVDVLELTYVGTDDGRRIFRASIS